MVDVGHSVLLSNGHPSESNGQPIKSNGHPSESNAPPHHTPPTPGDGQPSCLAQVKHYTEGNWLFRREFRS